MSTIHQDIDALLAADLHNELSEAERQALHSHLVECAECRQLHKEEKAMNTLLEENFAEEKPDNAFEQRLLARFRSAAPERTGFVKFIADLTRWRATQMTAIAAMLLALIQVGRMVTHDDPYVQPFGRAEANESATYASARSSVRTRNAFNKAPRAQPAAQAVTGGIAPQEAPTESTKDQAEVERVMVTGSNIPSAEEVGPNPVDTYRRDDITRLGVRSSTDLVQKIPAATGPQNESQSPAQDSVLANRKLVRNASVELEVASFEQALQKITAFANEDRGYIATTSSEKQENGKLKGEVVVKVAPENLDRFLGKLHTLGELKNQSITTEDVTKAYFDTDSRLKNARVMEQRLVEILKKKSDDINDLLQVEKELGRVRQEIEQMQGELKFMDAQVQFATVTITLAEKDMNVPAAFLLKERAQLSLYAPDVEKVYNDIKAVASPKVQITNAQLDRDNAGRISARISLLIAPEESASVIDRIKTMGRVDNFQVQTEREAQNGEGMSETARTERDKVHFDITLARQEEEQALQQTSLRIRTNTVDEKTKALRALAEKQAGRIRSSSFSRDPDGRESANVSLRVPMHNYNALMKSLDSLGHVEDVSVQRQDHTGSQGDEANAPVDISVQVYSQGNVISQQSGLLATLRHTIAQGASALMWSVRMIGVALAFIAPWAIALGVIIWSSRKIRRARENK